MKEMNMGEMEARFADLIWEKEPISSGELWKLAEERLTWKKSTTYTVLRRLIQKGIFQNENGQVTSRLTKDELAALQCERFVDDTFSGSLPLFLTAFASRRKLDRQEIEELQRMIDDARKTLPNP